MFQLYISQNQEDLSSRKKIWKPLHQMSVWYPAWIYLYWNMSLQLPYHRYISENLISHVSSLFAFQISQDKNLLHLGSPRANATFNNSVESRTSATIFYSVSESNCFRIARAVTTRIWYINSWSGIYTVINLYILPLHRILTFLHVQDNAINICMHSL